MINSVILLHLIFKARLQIEINKRLHFPVPVVQDIRVPEVVYQLYCSLQSRITHFTDLLRVKPPPFFTIELLIQQVDELCMDQVDKGITNITIVLSYKWSTL